MSGNQPQPQPQSQFNPNNIRITGHDSIEILSQTAHTFLDSFVGGIIPNINNSADQPQTGNIQKTSDYYIHSNATFFYYYFLMPGVTKENCKVNITNGKLVVSGKTTFEANTINNISYNRSLKLPCDIYISDITAKSKDGVFTISIPKKNENIDIQVN